MANVAMVLNVSMATASHLGSPAARNRANTAVWSQPMADTLQTYQPTKLIMVIAAMILSA